MDLERRRRTAAPDPNFTYIMIEHKIAEFEAESDALKATILPRLDEIVYQLEGLRQRLRRLRSKVDKDRLDFFRSQPLPGEYELDEEPTSSVGEVKESRGEVKESRGFMSHEELEAFAAKNSGT